VCGVLLILVEFADGSRVLFPAGVLLSRSIEDFIPEPLSALTDNVSRLGLDLVAAQVSVSCANNLFSRCPGYHRLPVSVKDLFFSAAVNEIFLSQSSQGARLISFVCAVRYFGFRRCLFPLAGQGSWLFFLLSSPADSVLLTRSSSPICCFGFSSPAQLRQGPSPERSSVFTSIRVRFCCKFLIRGGGGGCYR
jgi:hypothetical protein